MLLAGDLAAADVPVTVLERRTQESNLSRAFVVHARTLELLDARGLADELIATGQTLNRLSLFDPVVLDLSRLPSRFPFLLVTRSITPSGCLNAGPGRWARRSSAAVRSPTCAGKPIAWK